ncbi:hypothetical protein BGZ98_007770 [Dissophora globulifera]|nr:hypothetical protein BGZ98_007770 [Dissophora globulifera]
MGGITLADNPPDDPEGSFTLPGAPFNANVLKDLNLCDFASSHGLATATSAVAATTNASMTHSSAGACARDATAPTFSISDFLVPSMQTKVWEDWQAADDFTTAFDPQTFSSDISALSFHGLDGLIGNTPVWENFAVPADQAYDEYVFDLPPSAFETPATVNVADLIVGPNSMSAITSAPASISPLELAMSNDSIYQDLALANLYGFNDVSSDSGSDSGSGLDSDSDSDSGSDSCSDDGNDDSDVSQDGDDDSFDNAAIEMQNAVEPIPASSVAVELIALKDDPVITSTDTAQESSMAMSATKPEDPNKRRMEEALVARICNDLGPEHMAGLFRILKSTTGAADQDDDEDEEMEVDLSCLDETTLVEVYQYVETCCMQMMGSILAAEQQRERAITVADMEALARQKTPELSPSHHSYLSSSSSSSSSASSPVHPSSHGALHVRGRRSSIASKKKRSGGVVHAAMAYNEMPPVTTDLAQDAPWSASAAALSATHPYKGSRKRSNTIGNSHSHCSGSGSRRMQSDTVQQYQQQQQHHSTITGAGAVATAVVSSGTTEMDLSEDAEIDVVGI